MKSPKKRKFILIASSALILMLLIAGLCVADYFNLLPKKTYTAEKFGIDTLRSGVDFNGNGTDDYTDFLLGARKDAENHPKYDGSYLDGGFPPDNIGVCTDVIWRASVTAHYRFDASLADDEIKTEWKE